MSDARIDLLLRNLERAFDVRSWHGTNLFGSLRGVTPELASWRPQPARHNIAELAVHAAYWKYRVCRTLADRTPRSFTLRGSNFFLREGVRTPAEWGEDLALLKRWHEELIEVVKSTDPNGLRTPAGSDRFTRTDLILGAAAHDLYHAGQIQLIKRLQAGAAH
jgi:hypothetical protein